MRFGEVYFKRTFGDSMKPDEAFRPSFRASLKWRPWIKSGLKVHSVRTCHMVFFTCRGPGGLREVGHLFFPFYFGFEPGLQVSGARRCSSAADVALFVDGDNLPATSLRPMLQADQFTYKKHQKASKSIKILLHLIAFLGLKRPKAEATWGA